MTQEIIDFVERNSWFEWEDGNGTFATRENGRRGDNDEYGEKDYMEGLRIKKLLQEKFPYLQVYVETCDEWVLIEIEDED